MVSRYAQHARNWNGCKRCPLWETRRNVVLARGKIPADVLLIGEAPGPSEDVLAQPFIGPAGKLLDRAIAEANRMVAIDELGNDIVTTVTDRIAFSNLIACIPLDEEAGRKFTEPPESSIVACAPRLRELVAIAAPRAIVCVGGHAKEWVPVILESTALDARGMRKEAKAGGLPTTWVYYSVQHPAAILRMNVAQQGLAYQQLVVTLSDVFDSLRS